MVECFYCGRPLYETGWKVTDYKRQKSIIEKLLPFPKVPKVFIDWPRKTKDHVIPRSRGGGIEQTIVPACAECNQEKDRLTLEEYRVVKAFRYGYISNVEFKFPGEQ